MQSYEGIKRAGHFTLADGTEVQGELSLKGAATTLDLHSAKPFDPHESPDILGMFYDRSKVSLIKCITMSRDSGGRCGEQYHHSRVFPHFVIFGDRHIRSTDRTIRELSFTVDDAATLFHDFDAFGLVLNARPHMERIVEAEGRGRKIEIGEDPRLFYFSGKREIFTVDTVLGKISAWHCTSYKSPGPEGIHVDNTIKLNIAYDSERTVAEVIASVQVILRFLEVIAGRPQNISDLNVWLASAEEHPAILDVYWCMPPHRRHDAESAEPHPGDLPIQAGTKPDEFTSILKCWLDRHDEWRRARQRFSTAFAYQNRYDIDRIVGAANMFDILPSSAYPEPIALPPDLHRARVTALNEFKALPASPERDSVLSALGRIGKPALKRKVRSRAKLITDIIGDQLPELDLAVDQAVDCRNHYVHGTNPRFDYGKHYDQVIFLTKTLEFVFAASDLVQSGWDITAWIKRASGGSHPFGWYRLNYRPHLRELRNLLCG